MRRKRSLIALVLCSLTASSMALAQGRNGPAGGSGGDAFEDPVVADAVRIAEVRVWESGRINGIQVVVKTSGSFQEQPVHGQSDGNLHSFLVNDGEYVTAITGRMGQLIDSVQFHLNSGRTSPRFGGSGGDNDYFFEAPDGAQVIGVLGRAGRSLDAIGARLASAPAE